MTIMGEILLVAGLKEVKTFWKDIGNYAYWFSGDFEGFPERKQAKIYGIAGLNEIHKWSFYRIKYDSKHPDRSNWVCGVFVETWEQMNIQKIFFKIYF